VHCPTERSKISLLYQVSLITTDRSHSLVPMDIIFHGISNEQGSDAPGRAYGSVGAYCKHLAQDYPSVRVEPDQIFIRDGAISTSRIWFSAAFRCAEGESSVPRMRNQNTLAHTRASHRSEKSVYPSRNRLTRESIPPLVKLINVIGWLQIDLARANAERSRLRHKSGRGVDRAGCADSDKKVSFIQGGVDLADLKRHLAEPDDVRAKGACPSAG
jgi:hypothetical protein